MSPCAAAKTIKARPFVVHVDAIHSGHARATPIGTDGCPEDRWHAAAEPVIKASPAYVYAALQRLGPALFFAWRPPL